MLSRAALASATVAACLFAGLLWHAATRGDGWRPAGYAVLFTVTALLVVMLVLVDPEAGGGE